MKKKSIIYLAQCTIDRDQIYVGKTHQENLEVRIIQHEQKARFGDSTPFHKTMIEYGLRNWEWKVLEICDIEEEFEKETGYIQRLNASPIDLLNVSQNRKTSSKQRSYLSKILEGKIAKRAVPLEKSELGKAFLIQDGKLKPIINLKTNKIYESLNNAAKVENINISTLRNCCKTGKMLKDGTKYAFLDIDNNPVVTEGHSKDVCIGQRLNAKKVKNLISGKIYQNSYTAAKYYNVSPSIIDGAARGKYMVILEKYVFCFLDENGNELINDKHKKGLEKLSKKEETKYVAWHIEDSEMNKLLYFKKLDELCNNLEIKSKAHVKAVCDGQRSHAEKWRIAYYDSIQKSPILTDKHKEKPKRVIRELICLNDNKVFKNGIAAGRFYGISSQQITKCAAGFAKSVYKGKDRLRFAFIDEFGTPILTDMHSESLSTRGDKRIIRISTGELFNSLAEYIRKTGISYKRAKKYLKDQTIDLMGFEFIEIKN